MKILLFVDGPTTRGAMSVSSELQCHGCTVVTAPNGEAGLHALYEHEPDVVVLDVTAPEKSGLEALRAIRRVSEVPVLILTSRGGEAEQVRALEEGADDYIVKPIGPPALMARIRALLRRSDLPPPAHASPDFAAGELAVHFDSQRVTVGGERVRLTPLEYRLLYQLVRRAGRVLSHELLLDRVWGRDTAPSHDYIKVFVSRLRSKLEHPGGPRYIENQRGAGYRFVRPEPHALSA